MGSAANRAVVHIAQTRFFEQVVRDGKTFEELKVISTAKQWRAFERMLGECLTELGYEVVEKDPVKDRGKTVDGRYDIYSHRCRREVDGDLFYKQMHLKELFTLDPQGWGADHSRLQAPPELDGVDPRAAAAFCRRLARYFLETGSSKHPQSARLSPSALPEDYVFVPIQTAADYVIVHHSPISVKDFVALLAQWASRRGQDVVFKLHPGQRDAGVMAVARDRAARLDRVHLIDGNVHDLVRGSKGVFVINSGVGFESLIHGKPVVTFGNCDYRWLTFQGSPETLDDALRYADGYTEAQLEAGWRFVYSYCFEHGYLVSEANTEGSRQRLLRYLDEALAAGGGPR